METLSKKEIIKQAKKVENYQVREATIAECRENLWNKYGLYRDFYEIKKEFDNLPTDRIKIEE